VPAPLSVTMMSHSRPFDAGAPHGAIMRRQPTPSSQTQQGNESMMATGMKAMKWNRDYS
jgi:hypothetical protein